MNEGIYVNIKHTIHILFLKTVVLLAMTVRVSADSFKSHNCPSAQAADPTKNTKDKVVASM